LSSDETWPRSRGPSDLQLFGCICLNHRAMLSYPSPTRAGFLLLVTEPWILPQDMQVLPSPAMKRALGAYQNWGLVEWWPESAIASFFPLSRPLLLVNAFACHDPSIGRGSFHAPHELIALSWTASLSRPLGIRGRLDVKPRSQSPGVHFPTTSTLSSTFGNGQHTGSL
jgi:hypothetical protein